MIQVTMKPAGFAPKKGLAWIAEANVGGVEYAEASHSGATCKLARALVDAGVTDASFFVKTPEGVLTIDSFHKHAKTTYTEGGKSICRVKYVPLGDAFA